MLPLIKRTSTDLGYTNADPEYSLMSSDEITRLHNITLAV